MDLWEQIDYRSLQCCNAKVSKSASNVLKQGYRNVDDLLVESDTDEQLLFNIPFNQKVRLQSISFKAPEDESAPKTIKLYINKPSFGFSDIDSSQCVQEIILTPELLKGEQIPLKPVKFNNVDSLSIFVQDNQGDEETTKVSCIIIHGMAKAGMNVAEIKKVDPNEGATFV